MAAAKKPIGLGKRRIAEDEPEVYFPIEDDKNELEQVLVMYEHAEEILDEPEVCTQLVRAVIHECDRIGSLKEKLDNGESIDNASEEQLNNLKSLILTDDFYRVFGDALYRLAFLEATDEDGLPKLDLLEAAIERYAVGLEQFPNNTTLEIHLKRANLVYCGIIRDYRQELDNLPNLIDSSSNSATTLIFFTEAYEKIFPILNRTSEEFISLLQSLERLAAKYYQDKKTIELGMAHLSILIALCDYHFDKDEHREVGCVLEIAKSTIEEIRLKEMDRTMHRYFLQLLAQYYIWKGCLEEVFEYDSEESDAGSAKGRPDRTPKEFDPDKYYSLAIEIWHEIADKYSVDIPDHVLELIAE